MNGFAVAGASSEAAPARGKFTRPTSLPRAQSDFNMLRLFKIQSGDVLLASNNIPVESLNRELQIRFKKNLRMSSQGLFQLGSSCALRSVPVESNSNNYVWTAMLNPTTQTIEAGSEYSVQKIILRPGQLRAQLSLQKAQPSTLEIFCENPRIQDWTVTGFEIRTRGVLELRSNIQRDPATESRAYKLPGESLRHLSGSEYNGYFGSGLPGTSGVQLLIGSNPKAFADNGNRALWVGNRCAVLGEESPSNSARYTKDSKFAYQGKAIDLEKNKVRFQFRNWGYSLENLTIECQGSPAEVLEMTTAQVEADLNHSIHFYNK